MQVLQYGNPILHKVANSVTDINNKKVKKAINELKEFYEFNSTSQGLTAPQLGFSLQIALCKLKKEKPIIMLNPVLLKRYGNRTSKEGSESTGGKMKQFKVKRPLFGIVQYQTESGEFVERKLWYKKIRVMCHLIDNLNGIYLPDNGKECKRFGQR